MGVLSEQLSVLQPQDLEDIELALEQLSVLHRVLEKILVSVLLDDQPVSQ